MEIIFFILVIGFIGILISNNKTRQPPTSRVVVEQDQSKKDSQARHLQNTLIFAKTQHKYLNDQRKKQDIWLRQYGKSKVAELDVLDGENFEEFLAGLFGQLGYIVELTPASGDYGADLILSKDSERIAVQAKRYAGSVGVSAVQEVLAGKVFYKCGSAWVVTTGFYTSNATKLAKRSDVRMIGRHDLGDLMAKLSLDNQSDQSR